MLMIGGGGDVERERGREGEAVNLASLHVCMLTHPLSAHNSEIPD